MELLPRDSAQKVLDQIPTMVLDTIQKYPGSFIAGGYLRDIYGKLFVPDYVKKTPAKDIDVFFDKETSFFSMKEYLHRHYKIVSRAYDGEETFNSNKNMVLHINDGYESHVFNLIRWPKLFANPTEIVNEFNYTINCIATDGWNVWVIPQIWEDLNAAQLQLIRLTDPVLHVKKLQKYASYGFRLTHESAIALVMKIKLGDYETYE